MFRVEVAGDAFRKVMGSKFVMTLGVVKSAPSRVRADRIDAAIARGGYNLIAEAPRNAIAAVGRRYDVGQVAAQLGGEHAAPRIKVQPAARRWDYGARCATWATLGSAAMVVLGRHLPVSFRRANFSCFVSSWPSGPATACGGFGAKTQNMVRLVFETGGPYYMWAYRAACRPI
jgi:hypothetical protein